MTENPFGDLDDYLALPRVSGLAVSPDGSRVVTTVSELNEKRTEYVSAIWELDPRGQAPARRLTEVPRASRRRRSHPTVTCCSSRCARPTTTTSRPRLCGICLRRAARPSRSSRRPAASTWSRRRATSPRAVVRAPLLPSARRRRRRSPAAGSAQGQQDHRDTAYRLSDPALGQGSRPRRAASARARPRRRRRRRLDLTPRPGGALRDADFDVSPDGRFVVTSWQRPGAWRVAALRARARRHRESGEHTVIADEPDADLWSPAISPDGSAVAYIRESYSTPAACAANQLGLHAVRRVCDRARRGLGSLAGVLTWSRDGDALARHSRRRRSLPGVPDRHRRRRGRADDHRRLRLHRRDGRARRRRLCVAQLLRRAATPSANRSGRRRHRRCRVSSSPRLPGSLTEMRATTADGTAVRSWLVLPDAATPRAGAAAAVGARRTVGQLELLALAVEPVGAGRTRIRGAAAGPGAVDRLRPGLHPARVGHWGRRAVRGSDGRHRRCMRRTRASTRRAPPRWAARSAGTWRTGSQATPTGSTRSSPTPACGRSTSSTRPPTPPTTGCAR